MTEMMMLGGRNIGALKFSFRSHSKRTHVQPPNDPRNTSLAQDHNGTRPVICKDELRRIFADDLRAATDRHRKQDRFSN